MTPSDGGTGFDLALVDEVSTLLQRGNVADDEVRNRLISLLYPELHRLAKRHMKMERDHHTLQTTGLIHEFFLEIARQEQQVWASRSHFLAAASQAMRRLLIDYARGRNADKRGSNPLRIELDDAMLPVPFKQAQLLEIDELLDHLAAEQPRMAQIVEMRCFGGLTGQEIGEALGINERTVKRDWRVAKAWLSSQLRKA